jgi:hypothetical protein
VKPSLVVLAAGSILLAAPAASPAVAKAPCGNVVRQYGHIKSMTRKAGRFEMRFDPAWWLSGVPAQRAAVEDKVIRPGEAVPNDYYIVEEGHRLLTYVVATSAHVTVLTGGGVIHPSLIAVSELAQIVRGKNPKHRRLFEPKAGFWIRIDERYPSPVLSLEQQHQP